MAADDSGKPPQQTRRTFGQLTKQAGLSALFGTILIIPRIRRLRRRVWAWTCVRLAAGACGGLLAWRSALGTGHAAMLTIGLFLVGLAVLIGAKLPVKSADALSQELGALIVLNGGTFRSSSEASPVAKAQIFVHPQRIIVIGSRERRLLEIPLAAVQNLVVYPVSGGSGDSSGHWEVGIVWSTKQPCKTTFRYGGPFAEHLARITETTLHSQWKKELPIIG
jgi:hypothetical protein